MRQAASRWITGDPHRDACGTDDARLDISFGGTASWLRAVENRDPVPIGEFP